MSVLTCTKCTNYNCLSLKTNMVSDCNCTICSCLYCMIKNKIISINDAKKIEDNNKCNYMFVEKKEIPIMNATSLRNSIMLSLNSFNQKI